MTHRSRHRPRTALIAVGLAALAACGTRLPDEAFVNVNADGSSNLGPGEEAVGDPSDNGNDGPVSTTPDGSTIPSSANNGNTGNDTPGGSGDNGNVPAGPNQASDTGITETTIRLGNITAENGVLGDAFAPAARGLRAWVEFTNDNGGINGRQIELFTCDDREERNRSLECARRLVEQDDVFALVATNTRALGGAAQYLNDQGVPVIGNPITNSFYRYPHFYTVYGTGYPRDGQTVGINNQLVSQSGIYRWFRETLGVTEAAVFAYDIDESAQAGDFVVQGLQLEGFNVTRYNVSFAAPSFDQAVADMEQRGVQLVMDVMDDGANRRLCDSMGRRNFSVTAKISTIVAFGESIGTDFHPICRDSIYITGDSAAYSQTQIPEVAEFRDAFARYQPGVEVHQWALEAWAMANLTADAIASMGPAPTREGFEAYLNSVDDYTGNGIMQGWDNDWQDRDEEAERRRDCFMIARWQDNAGGWIQATQPAVSCYDDAFQFRTNVRELGN